MVAKFNSKAHLLEKFAGFFEPFRPRLHSKFVKSANMIKTIFFFQKRNTSIQKQGTTMAKEESEQGTSEAGNNPKMDQASQNISKPTIKPEETVEGTNAQMETGKKLEGAVLFCKEVGGKGGVGEGQGVGRKIQYRQKESQSRHREGRMG